MAINNRLEVKAKSKEICNLYLYGKSITDLSKQFYCSITLIHNILKNNNIPRRPIGFYPGHKQFNSGKTHFKKGCVSLMKGRKHTEEAKQLNSLNNLGRKPWNKGLTRETDLRVLKYCQAQENKFVSESTKNKIKEARAKQIVPMNDTSIEVKIQNFLKQLNIEFFTHYYCKEISHAYQCDILINPQPNFMAEKKTIIECDGDYWHGNPKVFPNLTKWQKEQIEEDLYRNEELINSGFNIVRLWEKDIKKMNLEEFKCKLISIIKIKND